MFETVLNGEGTKGISIHMSTDCHSLQIVWRARGLFEGGGISNITKQLAHMKIDKKGK